MNYKKKFFLFFFTVWLFLSPFLESFSEVYFSPEDHIGSRLIKLINSAQKKIYAAVYMITDKTIAQALIKAKNRGIDVQIITDKISKESIYGKAFFLKSGGICVSVFNPPESTYNSFLNNSSIMHNKFALIDGTLWTGSFNWTQSASQRNQENVILTDEKDVCNKYEKQFEKLKKQCYEIRRSDLENEKKQTKKN
jgi:mitochondrial cardiolipin hydrolase